MRWKPIGAAAVLLCWVVPASAGIDLAGDRFWFVDFSTTHGVVSFDLDLTGRTGDKGHTVIAEWQRPQRAPRTLDVTYVQADCAQETVVLTRVEGYDADKTLLGYDDGAIEPISVKDKHNALWLFWAVACGQSNFPSLGRVKGFDAAREFALQYLASHPAESAAP